MTAADQRQRGLDKDIDDDIQAGTISSRIEDAFSRSRSSLKKLKLNVELGDESCDMDEQYVALQMAIRHAKAIAQECQAGIEQCKRLGIEDLLEKSTA